MLTILLQHNFDIWDQAKKQSMRKQLRERLRVESNAEMADSIIFHTEQSFIHELQDLLDKQQQPNDQIFFASRKTLLNGKNGLTSPRSHNLTKALKSKNQAPKDTAESIMSRHRSRNKIDFNRLSEQVHSLHANRANFKGNIFDLEEKQKRRMHKEPSFFQVKKQSENNALRTKFDYSRSSVVKNKDFIYRNVVEKCQNCGQPKSEVFRSNLVCKNRKCRLLHYYEDFQTFPLSGILYDIEASASTTEQLEQLMKKIKEEVRKIEEWRDSLMELHYEVNSILESRQQVLKRNKNELKNFISCLTQIKSKKMKENELEIQNIRSKLQKIQLRQLYDQFNRWKKVDPEKFVNAKTISDMIHKCKPLCLKNVNSDLAEQIADISDNFNNLSILVNASEFISYNFVGNLSKIVLVVDGSIQVKRDNFLCIENLQELKLIFHCRKTSRQLRELFNILPNPNSLIFNFDYKLNSHLSSETFPLITQAFESARKSIEVNLQNARLEVFDDLIGASKIMKPKQKIHLSIHLNPFIPEGEWPDQIKCSDWGTKIIKNLIRNMGNKAIKILFNIPVVVNLEQISEFIINADYYLLTQIKMNPKLDQREKNSKIDLQTLLGKMAGRKKLLFAHLLNQKRHNSHPLNMSRGLAETVYQSLF